MCYTSTEPKEYTQSSLRSCCRASSPTDEAPEHAPMEFVGWPATTAAEIVFIVPHKLVSYVQL